MWLTQCHPIQYKDVCLVFTVPACIVYGVDPTGELVGLNYSEIIMILKLINFSRPKFETFETLFGDEIQD